ncbi:DUF1080 domain-containing protein [Luteitalea sp.]|uniref:3-keto-disaccharide hydrolase n=1 Tax=Luteitalea sp. TaxID=2004800 RepID=UPI0025BA7875|nr:DUF1080 domain-containing protein [Luteitalea sp.]
MQHRVFPAAALIAALLCVAPFAHAQQNQAPEGFTALFDGKTLDGWWGWGTKHYDEYMKLDAAALKALQEQSRIEIRKHWRVENGELVGYGKELFLTTNEFYEDFELLVEYKTVPTADSGIYLRGCPQVQIWDWTKAGGKWELGADKGSGGLWNNKKGSKGRDPLVLADKPFGEWNSFRITMVGDIVTVYLNDKLVVDHARMHNFFLREDQTQLLADQEGPMPKRGPIQLQTYGDEVRWRNVFIRKIDAKKGNN